MPPTRFDHIKTSSVQAGAAAQPRRTPKMSSGTAALPCPRIVPWPTNSAVIKKIIWLLPPMASAVVPNQPSTLGWGAATEASQDVELMGSAPHVTAWH
jgi:hypothetical protein